MQVKKILVPMDFSPLARLAVRHAMLLARRCRARLTLMHVVEPSALLSYAFPKETIELERDHIEQARRMLAALVSKEECRDLDLRTVVKSGNIGDEIFWTVNDEGMDVVVMGTHGRGFLARSIIGSVTQDMLTRLEIPVLTVRQFGAAPAFDRILFATDLTKSSTEALDFCLEMAQAMGSQLIALHAVEVGLEGGAEAAVYLGKSRVDEARARLEEWKSKTPWHNMEVDAVLAETKIDQSIIKAAERDSADLIAVALTDNGPGPVAEAIILEARMPVLSVPAVHVRSR